MMRERKSRGKEEAHLVALFDYFETGSEKVQEADEKEKRKQKFQDAQRFIFEFP